MRTDPQTAGFGARLIRAIRAVTGTGLGLALIVSLVMSLSPGTTGFRLVLDAGPLPARLALATQAV